MGTWWKVDWALRGAAVGLCVGAMACDGTSDPGGRNPGSGGMNGTGATPGTGAMGGTGAFGNPGTGAFGNPGGQMGTGALAGTGSSEGTGGTEGCANVDVKPKASFSPGNLLVIFDRSLSMEFDFAGTQRRVAASNGLIAAITPFTCDGTVVVDGDPCTDNLTIGALMFPSAGAGCDASAPIAPLTDPEQINWMKSTDFVQAWQAYWPGHPTLFGTPISPAFNQAATEIDAAKMTLEGNFAVLFLTDGEGTCDAGVAAPPQAMTWAAEGIPTYVVNVNPMLGGAGASFNDSVASAGGTTMSINPTDQAQLDAALRKVLQETAKVESCDLSLEGTITNPEAACEGGEVFLGPRKLECSDTDGYMITGDKTITLVGTACDELMAGGFLDAVFPCEAVDPD